MRQFTTAILLLASASSFAQSGSQTSLGGQAGRTPSLVTPALVRYVDVSAVGANDGTSWIGAFTDLQDALTGTAGAEIWVAAGVYTPSDVDAALSFVLQNGFELYGGFDGTETQRAQRNWSLNETILSGDIGGDDVVAGWPSGWNIGTANSGHVVVASGTDSSTILDGFTVANGSTGPSGTGAGNPLMIGGGIYMVSGSPTVRNCRFIHNLAAFGAGGGIYCHDGSPSIENCQFTQNYTHSGNGGGAYFTGASQPSIRDCGFDANVVVSTSISGGDGNAAALGLDTDLWPTVERCVFSSNLARSFWPVGDAIAYGGGIWSWNGGVTVVDCVFAHNTAHYGAGIMTWGPALVVNCLFQDNTAAVKPNDPYPEQGGYGAGLAAWSAAPDMIEVVNSTFAYNHGKKAVGLVTFWSAQLELRNCVVWGNVGSHPEVIGYWTEQLNGDFDLAYSCIAKIFDPHGPGEDPIDPGDLPGCIDVYPNFVSGSAAGDLRLAPGSACIDAGDNGPISGTLTDLAGESRFIDDPATVDTGAGTAPIVDMGAFEFGG